MKRHVRMIVFSLFLFLLSTPIVSSQSLPIGTPETVGMSAERLDRLRDVMQRYVDDERVAGIVTLVIRHGEVADFKSYGQLSREEGLPMRNDAIFRIASQSKAVTTTAVMMLFEEGRLLLSDPVSKYIPDFAGAAVAIPLEDEPGYRLEPAQRPITIEDLLTHTAGIGYGSESPAIAAHTWENLVGWNFTRHDEPIGDAIGRLANLPLVSQPGEKFVYGFNTDILGYVVEIASGMSLAEFFQRRIFEPLKMVDSHFYLPPEKVNRFSAVYGTNPNGGLYLYEAPEDNFYVKGPRRCYSGGAGLLSTAQDYGRFLLMLLNGGELEGVRLLSSKTVELMTSNHTGDLYNWGKRGFGLGFWVTEHVGKQRSIGSVGAFGWGGAYHTTYWVDPEEDMVALLMCQLLPAIGSDLHGKFETLVYQSIVD